jgi:hypothetical protein
MLLDIIQTAEVNFYFHKLAVYILNTGLNIMYYSFQKCCSINI